MCEVICRVVWWEGPSGTLRSSVLLGLVRPCTLRQCLLLLYVGHLAQALYRPDSQAPQGQMEAKVLLDSYLTPPHPAY